MAYSYRKLVSFTPYDHEHWTDPSSVADAAAPVISSNTTYPGTYTFAFVDLSIPPSKLPNGTDLSTLVPGLGAGRTTRLHWWMDGVTQSSDGTFTGSSTLAPYEGPQPPPGDSPHDYVLYLFNRPANFTPPANAVAFYDAATYLGDDRFNFSVTALAAQVGAPIAARYIQVQNITTTSTLPSSNSTTTSAGNGTLATASGYLTSPTNANSSSNSTSGMTPTSTVATYSPTGYSSPSASVPAAYTGAGSANMVSSAGLFALVGGMSFLGLL